MSALMDTVNFPQWIKEQREIRGWSQSEFSRVANISRQVVSDYEGYKRKYFDDDILLKIARAFKLPPEIVFRAAGILPPSTEDEWVEEMTYKLETLDPNLRDIATRFIDSLAEKEAAEKRVKSLKPSRGVK